MLGLKINNPDNLDLNAFCKYLIPLIKIRGLDTSKLSNDKVKQWDEYFEKVFAKKDNIPTIKNILRLYFNNLIISKETSDNSYLIHCNKNIKYPKLDTTVDILANTISNGTIEVPRYSIFDNAFEDISIDVPKLYKIYRGI